MCHGRGRDNVGVGNSGGGRWRGYHRSRGGWLSLDLESELGEFVLYFFIGVQVVYFFFFREAPNRLNAIVLRDIAQRGSEYDFFHWIVSVMCERASCNSS